MSRLYFWNLSKACWMVGFALAAGLKSRLRTRETPPFFAKNPSRPLNTSRKWNEKKKAQNHSNQRTILSFLMPPAGLEPALCRQKGILSPSCLPAFGKVNFHSLYRLIFHCERDFSFASERDSLFFDKIILPSFSLHVNHVKLFHPVVLDLRSVRGPEHRRGRLLCPDALLRVGDSLIGVLIDWLGRWVTSVF